MVYKLVRILERCCAHDRCTILCVGCASYLCVAFLQKAEYNTRDDVHHVAIKLLEHTFKRMRALDNHERVSV